MLTLSIHDFETLFSHQAYLPCLVLYVLRPSLLILVRALLATGWIDLVFSLNLSFAVNNRLTFCSVIDIAIDSFTSEDNIFRELQRCLCLQSRPHFWTRMRVSVWHSQAADRPICDPGRIFIAWHREVLTVPWSHYIANNFIYFQSYLLYWWELNCKRFIHNKGPCCNRQHP